MDDDAASAEELGELISGFGFPVRTAADPVDALHTLIDGPDIAIAVIDLRMPKLDGIGLVNALARKRRDLPAVIFMSGNATMPDAVSAIRIHAVDLLLKPIKRADLQAALARSRETVMRRRRDAVREFTLRHTLESVAGQCLRVLNGVPGLPELAGVHKRQATEVEAQVVIDASRPVRAGRLPALTSSRRDALETFLRGRLDVLLQARQTRAKFFDAELLEDSCWEMLLDLMRSRLVGRPISVSSLCIAAGVPQTTGLRRIGTLEKKALIVRRPDPVDRRRVFIELTDLGAAQIQSYLTSIDAP